MTAAARNFLADCFAVRRELSPRARNWLTFGSFVLPILLWCLVSYVPIFWHPMVKVSDPGGVSYFQPEMLVDRVVFEREV